ncbi:MAG: 50S ribosomal protein L28 [Bdellovibrio sp.]|nr:MAG: 50S ribosomal protein L28 [Bdellovibrio sp.]
MPRCELTGKGPVVKNLVSHSNIKTKSRAFPNIQKKQLFSTALGEMVSLYVATSTLRSMEHKGGFDAFILTQPEETLSKRAQAVRRRILKRLSQKSKNSSSSGAES